MTLARAQDMPRAFARAWGARDASAIAALFAEDADFVNVVGLWWRNRSAIARAHAYGLTRIFAQSDLRVGSVTCRDLGTVAVVHARLHLSGQTTPQGAKAEARQTVMSFVMQRQEAGWLCVSAQNTDVVAGVETHVATGGRLTPTDYR